MTRKTRRSSGTCGVTPFGDKIESESARRERCWGGAVCLCPNETMRSLSLILGVLLSLLMAGCEPDAAYHARSLGGQLRTLYAKWQSEGCPADFNITNHFYVGGTNQAFFLTNKVRIDGSSYNCRFAIRSPLRFERLGLLVLTDQGVLLWLGEDGTMVVSPDKSRVSSSEFRRN